MPADPLARAAGGGAWSWPRSMSWSAAWRSQPLREGGGQQQARAGDDVGVRCRAGPGQVVGGRLASKRCPPARVGWTCEQHHSPRSEALFTFRSLHYQSAPLDSGSGRIGPPTIGRFARSTWRAWTRSAISGPGVMVIGIQSQNHRSSGPPISRRITQPSGALTSHAATAAITQRRSGARSVARARPTAITATRGSGCPTPRRARRATSQRVRRSRRLQAWTACLLGGVSISSSPIASAAPGS